MKNTNSVAKATLTLAPIA